MNFEWDIQKEQKNIAKHGLDFSTAILVFGDENRLEFYDVEHSDMEDRYITFVYVAYTERNRAIRIISARGATRREKEVYYESI